MTGIAEPSKRGAKDYCLRYVPMGSSVVRLMIGRREKRRGVVLTKLLIAAILATAPVAGTPGAGQGDIKGVLDKYQAVRPQAADLALYQLEWAPTLTAARERAAREHRPIFLVVVTNSFGDLYSGHC
jgi:hypothetical protein